jgi:alpha-D-xyloside xylohydrolase
VRIAPAGGQIVEPPISALLLPSEGLESKETSPYALVNNNLQVTADPITGFITATRVSDSVVLLKQNALVFGVPGSNTRPGSVSAKFGFAGHGSGERIYGGGEHRTGTLDLLNTSSYYQNLQDSQLYPVSRGGDSSIPIFFSNLGYSLIVNSPSYGTVNLSYSALTFMHNATLNVDFWITTTSSSSTPGVSIYRELHQSVIDVTGHGTPLPYYATGFIQCKDRYRNQTQLLDVAQGYASRSIAVSVIVVDWMHWISEGDWSFNPACWPDPQGMVDNLRTLGIEPMVTFWPFQTEQSKNYPEFFASNYLATSLNSTPLYLEGNYYLVDQTNEYAAEATFQKFWQGYGQYGFKTIWLDAAEPERQSDNFGQFLMDAGTDTEIGQGWIQKHVKAFADGFASKGISGDEYFVLPRHAWAGTWRYSAALWSGDIESTFAELYLQVRVGQGAGLTAPIMWTTDTGGYWGGDPTDPVFQELIVRWFQFSAFSNLFRLHGHRAGGPPSDPQCGGTNGDNEIWNLATDPAHYNAIVAVMHLRESLREYISQINVEAVTTGWPMMRAMFLEFPDLEAQGPELFADQFMFGKEWLVRPVTTYQATSVSVYLPALDTSVEYWVYYFNSSIITQSGWVTVETPIGEFPCFYRWRVTPSPPPSFGIASSMFDASREDQVLCVSSDCNSANDGSYTVLTAIDSYVVLSSSNGSVTINGVSYETVPLNLFFSFNHTDNYVASNATAPDDTYTVTFNNGFVLATQAPGTVPLQVLFKQYTPSYNFDYATISSNAESQAWAAANNYTYLFTTGYAWLTSPSYNVVTN